MRDADLRRLTKVEGVLAFARSNPSEEQDVTLLVGAMTTGLEKARALVKQRAEREQEARGESKRARETRRRLRGVLALVSKSGVAAGKASPELVAKFRQIRPRASIVEFTASARALLEAGREHAEAIVGHGASAERLDQAEVLLNEYVALLDKSRDARSAAVRIGTELKVAAVELMSFRSRLDALNRHRFADDPELKAAWKSALAIGGPVFGVNGAEPGAGAWSGPRRRRVRRKLGVRGRLGGEGAAGGDGVR
ncbi:MAG: hypothetical protein R2909_00150 [Gemmatimonadales bacterium]